ncbi:unnamed protein product [Laminaria digitata]
MSDRTHLHRAAQRGDIGAVRALVQAVDVNVRGGWRVESPLHAASRAGRPDVIECLVEAGARTEVRDRNNDTPLLLAAWLGHAAAIAMLLASGAGVNADGIPRSALHCACMQVHAGCVSELLRGGADEDAMDEDGNTPSQVIGTMIENVDEHDENIVAIHEMLRCAPADRVWRRRGWLAVLRARDCAAASLLPLPLPPISVVTRGAARRRAVVGSVGARPQVGPEATVFEGKTFSIGQPKTIVGTRRNQGGRAVGHGERRGSKRQARGGNGCGGGGGGGGSGGERGGRGGRSQASRKEGAKRNKRKEEKGAASEQEEADRQGLRNVVARLIGLGEEGAFRSVLSFL